MNIPQEVRLKYVPTAEFAPVLRRLIASEDAESITIISERAGLHANTLDKILRERSKGCDFDAADKLLCAMGAQHLWWGELAHIYYAVDLEWYDRPAVYRERTCGRGHVTQARVMPNGYAQCPVCSAESKGRYNERMRARTAERLAA